MTLTDITGISVVRSITLPCHGSNASSNLACPVNIMKCTQCNNETQNPRFCSRSCAATYNNKKYPKRKLQGTCLVCVAPIGHGLKYCSKQCRDEIRPEKLTKAEIQKRYRNGVKRRAVEYKGGKCIVCDYNRCLRGLEFHHLDPTKKDFQISRANPIAWDKIETELDKCVLVCCRCHREIHEGLIEL